MSSSRERGYAYDAVRNVILQKQSAVLDIAIDGYSRVESRQ